MSFISAVEGRRSLYSLSAEIPVSDERLEEIIALSIQNTPSAFHAQSGRVAVLKGEAHKTLWQLTLDAVRQVAPPEGFSATEQKIAAFAAAYGTLLFFEEQNTIEALQKQYPLYEKRFPEWSQQQSGILQYIVWTALSEAGIGANLQHYDPLIDNQVKARWNLPQSWRLMGEMPFGTAIAPPREKSMIPVQEKMRIFE